LDPEQLIIQLNAVLAGDDTFLTEDEMEHIKKYIRMGAELEAKVERLNARIIDLRTDYQDREVLQRILDYTLSGLG
jgi:hypothetical protein